MLRASWSRLDPALSSTLNTPGPRRQRTEISPAASSGQAVAGYSYYAFGQVRAASGTGDAWQFTGEQWDPAAGLYFLRARYYPSPALGTGVSPGWGGS